MISACWIKNLRWSVRNPALISWLKHSSWTYCRHIWPLLAIIACGQVLCWAMTQYSPKFSNVFLIPTLHLGCNYRPQYCQRCWVLHPRFNFMKTNNIWRSIADLRPARFDLGCKCKLWIMLKIEISIRVHSLWNVHAEIMENMWRVQNLVCIGMIVVTNINSFPSRNVRMLSYHIQSCHGSVKWSMKTIL